MPSRVQILTLVVLTLAACCLQSISPKPPESTSVYDRIAPGVVIVEKLGRLAGTGWAWDASHVITAAHVVEGGVGIGVVTHSGERCGIGGIATQPATDVAVIEITGCDVKPLDLAPTLPKPGDPVLVLSHQAGQPYSLTAGVVSSVARTDNGTPRLQVDAPMNPGSSGAPVLDGQGRVIGLASYLLSPHGAWAGLGFATPTPQIVLAVDALLRGLAGA